MKASYTYICLILTVLALLLCGPIGCVSKRYSNLPVYSSVGIPDYTNQSVGRFKSSYLAQQIDAHFRGNFNAPIGVTTFANINDLNESSTFGRMMAEQLISELAMLGYNVVELRKSDVIQILNREGEFGLSRDTDLIKPYQDLGGIVVGTYVDSPERVYINARVLDPRNGMVRSAGSVEMEKTRELSRLIRSSTRPVQLERIPVRNMNQSQQWPAFNQNRQLQYMPAPLQNGSEMMDHPPVPKLEPNA